MEKVATNLMCYLILKKLYNNPADSEFSELSELGACESFCIGRAEETDGKRKETSQH